MKLITGLGNPGQEYQDTRHNLGFMVIDELAKKLKVAVKFDKKLKADVAMLVKDETLILAKPQTYMNLCGDSIAKIAHFYKIDASDIWVISDDLDLDFGTIRVRAGGSSGGHNGLKDLIAKLGEGFTRFRVGIKNDSSEELPAEAFVLQKFSASEQAKLGDVTKRAVEVIIDSLSSGPEQTSIK
ncbi:aminoacyl-tRNA hydrolase [Candidatus Saccharibacteria bacterium]|nr:aminoacyl-tRNA hydrolase [Candidatus Saccharibacteria bacterium]